MTAEADNLIPDGVFEAQYYTDGDQHHGQSYCHAKGSNTNHRATHFPFVALVVIDLPGNV